MQRATLGKSGSKTSSQLQGQTARAFSRNSLGKTINIAVDYCKKSRMTILGLADVLFYENEQA